MIRSLEEIAQEYGAGYVKAHPFHSSPETREIFKKPVLIIDEAFFYPNEPGTYLHEKEGDMRAINEVLTQLRSSQDYRVRNNRKDRVRKVVMPITITYQRGGKENHAMAVLIQEDPKQPGHYDIALLEQHAGRKNDSKLDFIEERNKLRDYLRRIWEDAEIIENKQPFCTERGICDSVALKLCEALVKAKDAVALAKDIRKLRRIGEDAAQAGRESNGKPAECPEEAASPAQKTGQFAGKYGKKGKARTSSR